MKNHRLSLADVLDDCLMYMCIGMVALGVLTGEAHCQTLPEAPRASTPGEHDPGTWAFTTGFTSTLTGTFVKPKYGLMAGVAIAVLPNLQNSNNAHQNMVGGIIGAGVGYVVIKTLKHDWRKQ